MTRLKQTFLDLVQIPSPSLQERDAIDWVGRQLTDLGYSFEEDRAGAAIGGNAGNLLVRVPATGSGPSIFLSAHIDTVEKGDRAIVPREENGEIFSDGTTILAADDKTGCAALLELLACLKEKPVSHGELLIGFSVAEEIECLGAGAMDPDVYSNCDFGIVLDHSVPQQILLGSPTKVAMKITMHGVGGHGAFPERRVNAAHALTLALSRLPSCRLDDSTTANLGIVQAGTKINIIPETAYAEYEIRSHDAERVDFYVKQAEATIQAAALEHCKFVVGPDHGLGGDGPDAEDPVKHASAEIDTTVCYHCYRHTEETPVVRHLSQAIQSAGFEPGYVVAQGGSDANIYNRNNLPTAVIGCGMHGAHSVRERATPSEMEDTVRVLLEAVRA